MVDQGLINKEEALLRISPASISQLIHPVFKNPALAKAPFMVQGLPASPGAATGRNRIYCRPSKRSPSGG